MPYLEPVDLVLTDPPYPQNIKRINFKETPILFLGKMPIHQYIFWGGKTEFPLNYTARHRWIKLNGFGGKGYEFIYERNGNSKSIDYYAASINSKVSAQMACDDYTKHPTQKPRALFFTLLFQNKSNLVLDPFIGSGTTAIACERLNRRWIGIEIEEKYCEIAAKRIKKERQQLKLFA